MRRPYRSRLGPQASLLATTVDKLETKGLQNSMQFIISLILANNRANIRANTVDIPDQGFNISSTADVQGFCTPLSTLSVYAQA